MENIFPGLSLIIVIGAAVSLFMRYIRQPLMIGYILTGILVGPAVFHVLDSPHSLTVFGDIGIALLLFIIGLGMNPRVVKEVGKPSLVVTTSQMLVTGAISWVILVALGLTHREALFVSFGLTINSTIVALKLLSDRKEVGRLYGKLTIGASLVEDIFAAIALLLVASVHDGHWLALGPLVSLAFKGVVLGGAMYFVSRHLLPRAQKLIASDQEMLFLFAIAWGLGSAALLAKAGFSMEIGALAAGVFLAYLPYAQEIASRLRPLRDFFVIVFFISLGTQLTFNQFGQLFWPVVVGTLIVVTLKPLVIMTTLGLLGYTKRTSFKTATTLSQVSEFSIIFVVLGVQKGLVSQHIVVMLTFIALISIAVSTYLVTFSDQLYAKFEKYLDLFERRKDQGELLPEENNELVLFGYQRGGHEFVNLFKKLKKRYVVIDYDPEVIDTMERRKINYLYGDATDVELLEEAGVKHARLVVSTIPDFDVNIFLLNYLKHNNPRAVAILHADDPLEAARLYETGASYVVLPHYIGSEKVSSFISKSGLAKSAFRKERAKHLEYLERHYGALEKISQINQKKFGRAIVKSVASLTRAKA
jgi:Kef-type K+ transport system membrane component KefB/voltage-gated potassium channel Kch